MSGSDRSVFADRVDHADVVHRAQSVLRSTSDGVFFLDRSWRFIFLNAAAEALFDRHPGELLGRSVWTEFPAAGGSRSDLEYRRAMETGSPVTFDDYYEPLDTLFEVRVFPDSHGLAVFFRDVGEDRRARQKQEASARLTRGILDSLPAHTAVLSADGTITSTNGPWDAFGAAEGAGGPSSWGVGANYFDACLRAAQAGDADAVQALAGLQAVARGEADSFSMDYECSSPVTARWFNLHAVPVVGLHGIVVSHTDVTARVLTEQQLHHRAHHDDLTQLPNRVRLLQVLDEALASSSGSRDVAVLLVDLDGFKNINDSLGHDVGDTLLRDVAARFSRTVRGADIVARLGGDEFVVVAHDCGQQAATRLAGRIRAVLGDPFEVARMHLPVSASIGIALREASVTRTRTRTGTRTGTRARDLLRDADTAMYAAKSAGRDRSHLFSSDLGEQAHDRLSLVAGLRMAVRRNELQLHYQPIVRLPGAQVAEVEALMRWNHPVRGLLYPGSFIELAEETGIIVPMSRWLLAETLCQVAAWSRDGLDLAVAVNIAAQHLSVGTLIDDVTEALDVAGVAPDRLVVELTETDVARDLTGATAQLAELRRLGVRVAIDDFGSGYSSLGQLASLPADVLKIDRSLMADLGVGSGASPARTIVAAVTSIAGMLGMTTVAEGIETQDQLAAATALECTHAQGFLFARPAPADEVSAALRAT